MRKLIHKMGGYFLVVADILAILLIFLALAYPSHPKRVSHPCDCGQICSKQFHCGLKECVR